MIRPPLLPVLSIAWLAACNLEFIGPHSPAQYDVIVTFTDSVSALSSIQATLSPGFTADGDERNIPDDTINVWDQTLAPIGIDEDGVRSYAATIETDPRTLPNPIIATQPPPVGETAPPPDLQVSLVWRHGSHSIDVSRNADLVLRIANAQDLAGVADGRIWSLTIRRRSGQAIFRTSSLGLPPANVTVPSTALADAEVSVLDAVMEISYNTTAQGACFTCPTYVAELSVAAELFWTLNLTGPAN
jgi:hypothetical protein